MIDIESKVFDTVYNAVIAVFPEARVDNGYIERTAQFPAVEVNETNSVPLRRSATDDNSEDHTRLYYEINIYSDKQNTAKTEAKAIADVVDEAMTSLKFYRTMMHTLPAQERTIYRLYARYEVIVGETVDGEGNRIYQFYRR